MAFQVNRPGNRFSGRLTTQDLRKQKISGNASVLAVQSFFPAAAGGAVTRRVALYLEGAHTIELASALHTLTINDAAFAALIAGHIALDIQDGAHNALASGLNTLEIQS